MRIGCNGFLLALAMVAAVAPALAQRQVFERRAEIRGQRGDEGKCTIEVDVDDVAEVQIAGDRAWIHTMSGQPATFRRFVCSAPLPRNPYEFRFEGIDGRGRQTLVQEPRNGGRAIVRIEDPKGGREGYTFDLIWRGATTASPGPGGGDRPGYGGDRPGYGGDRPGGFGGGRWNDEVTFRGRGEGFYRNNRGANDRLFDCDVSISRGGEVRVTFQTEAGSALTLDGRVTRNNGDEVFADMSGGGVAGGMRIRFDRRRVREVNMSGTGRMRFELRWSN
jgi:hypothetical protein